MLSLFRSTFTPPRATADAHPWPGLRPPRLRRDRAWTASQGHTCGAKQSARRARLCRSKSGVRLPLPSTCGDGSPVVLLHGNAVRLEDFIASGLIDRLANTTASIALRPSGLRHGRRPRDRLWTADAQATLLDKAFVRLHHRAAHCGGPLMGCVGSALALALTECRRAKLVLISGYYFPTLRIDAPVFATPAIPLVGDVMRCTVSAVFARFAWLNRRRDRDVAPRLFHPLSFPRWRVRCSVRPSPTRAEMRRTPAFMIPAAIVAQALRGAHDARNHIRGRSRQGR